MADGARAAGISFGLASGLVLALAVALALSPVAAAQTAPVLLERVDGGDLVADLESNATARFSLFNLNPADSFFVSIQVRVPDDWEATALPEKFFLDPGDTASPNPTYVDVVVHPTAVPRSAAGVEVTFSFVHRGTGDVTKVVETFEVASGEPPRVFDFLANPLPSPLDNAYGTFLLEAFFWVVVALAAIFAGDALVRSLTTRAHDDVTREIITKLRRPIFYFVFLLGLSRSLTLLPPNPFVDFVARTFVAVAVGIFGLYVLYRVLEGALLYYQREIAPRTQNTLDDVLVPVIRKVGLVVLVIAGVIITLRTLGWDPTLVFAGAGIAGLVIAFAAQDTFSNLFSGIFLMVDQPFREGDDITLETGETARVESIGLRTTRLYDPRAHQTIIVPNNQLATRRIINHLAPDHRFWIMVDASASYKANPQHVQRVLLRVARDHPKIIKEDDWQPLVLFTKFGESSLDFTLRCAVESFRDRQPVASDLRFAIKAAFDAEGIEIPYPQRVVHLQTGDARS